VGENQIVQVEVTGRNGKTVMPIARLREGSTDCCNLNVMFTDTPVYFTLTKGCGPVHLIGNHTYSK
jgi:nucleophosmin 3